MKETNVTTKQKLIGLVSALEEENIIDYLYTFIGLKVYGQARLPESITAELRQMWEKHFNLPHESDNLSGEMAESKKIRSSNVIVLQQKKLVTDTLTKVGVNVADKGFYILRDIILNYLEYEIPTEAVQREVFLKVAKKYGMRYTSAYRNVKLLIDNISQHKSVDFLEQYFGIGYRADRGKVMPKTFIIKIVDDVNLQCEEIANRKSLMHKEIDVT